MYSKKSFKRCRASSDSPHPDPMFTVVRMKKRPGSDQRQPDGQSSLTGEGHAFQKRATRPTDRSTQSGTLFLPRPRRLDEWSG